MDAKAYWVGFNKIKGIGAARTKKLLSHFGNLESAWHASAHELTLAGIPPSIVEVIIATRSKLNIGEEFARIKELGIQITIVDDDEYPTRLKTIEQPPPVLFYKGNMKCTEEYAVAVVGTRHPTTYGKQIASELANFLVQNNITVVSGLARGIDSEAHQAVVEAGGSTIAVMGCGVDIVYPPEHRNLASRILEKGVILSDYPPGTQPEGINFPPRNRIISGLSLATVIVEAGERSGALITAEFAVNQSREVFAVPGLIYARQSKGTNRLIKDGAFLLDNFEELLEILNLNQVAEFRFAKKTLPVSEIESLLIQTIKNESMHIDDIKSTTGLSMEKVSATLIVMELKGLVKQVGNLTYISIGESGVTYEEG